MSTEDRVTELERSFITLTRLLESAGERAGTHESWINQLGRAQAETETKLAALVDAQIRSDDKIAALADAQIKTESALRQLIARVDKLTDALERHAADEHAHG